MVPVLILGVPIFDTAFVSFSRLRRGVPIWQGGRDHVSHLLRASGASTRRVVLVLYVIAVVLGAIGTLVSLLEPAPAYTFGACALVCALWLGWRLDHRRPITSG
jgi:UDP-GlcNAc:undecaprenyl-phosphate GlcNAc-1-phosphate transferase